MSATLEQVERLAADLSEADRVKLAESLSRSATGVGGAASAHAASADAALAEFRRAERRLMETSGAGPSLTEAVTSSRR